MNIYQYKCEQKIVSSVMRIRTMKRLDYDIVVALITSTRKKERTAKEMALYFQECSHKHFQAKFL